jgi:hypothetical protein
LASDLQLSVRCIWAASALAQFAVLSVLLLRGHARRLPFFTSYIVANLLQDGLLLYVYDHYGLRSTRAFTVGWSSEAVTLFLRLCATAEVIHLAIQAYRGIWGLAWRLLAITSLLVTIGVVAFSAGDPQWTVVAADRGYHLVFATALLACLLMIQHYRIEVPSIFKSLLIGFCGYSCIKILINAASPSVLYHFKNFVTVWQTLTLFPFVILLLFFAWALADPLPAVRRQQANLPADVYDRLVPDLQSQLALINSKLIRFFKIEEPNS